ncbi:hypothetical protein [Syntrophorhabdus aromaticivorans]|uniref:Uncharacterized protein n=1 Tax=Syntrophorhabdus aromaticivorans TaxID=328301 RepID=A0A351U6K5_9BACT|nr:hypothetical protein [Syntrophorhabdus aromaticivorans]NLW36084.1 hypothetical protein [Syntrophorhabdus aromaticivorans]HBA55586.1 hypothetical protein [Syntrophorhabdus aromaticivorans]
MDDYENEKPDWRELDRRRDKSRFYGRTEKDEQKERPKDRWQAGRVKQALDKLFMGKKGTVEHEKLYNKIHNSYGSDRFVPTVRKYMEKYGLPDDTSALLLILDTKEQDIICNGIDKLREIYKDLSRRQQEDVRRKLSILAMTDKSVDIRNRAGDVLEAIKE